MSCPPVTQIKCVASAMSSLEPCSEQRRRANPALAASNNGVLPQDMLRDILLRLPAKTLCRLRTVCRSWRSLLSDPLFIAVHRSCHPGPLIVRSVEAAGMNSYIDMMDLSGDVVKRISISVGDARVLSTRLDLIYVTGSGPYCLGGNVITHCEGSYLVNPATGATFAFPRGFSEEHRRVGNFLDVESFDLGHVSSTGEYKALRIFVPCFEPKKELCEVITLDGNCPCNARWRAKPGPPLPVASNWVKSVVVIGVVYFLADFLSSHSRSYDDRIEPGSIASFNLETEEWMATLRGPEPFHTLVECSNGTLSYIELRSMLSLANLNDCLVTVHLIDFTSLDLWFSVDLEKGIWEKKYIIGFELEHLFARPLLTLDDGRIALAASGLLRIYDPITDSYTDFEMRGSSSLRIYTGSLLSLESTFNNEVSTALYLLLFVL